MDALYDFYLHYNPFTKEWVGVPRESAASYQNSVPIPHLITAKTVEELIKAIIKD